MHKTQHLAHNAALNSTELIDMIASNIVGYGTNGHRAMRWSFADFLNGPAVHQNGYSMKQGRQEPRPGEWTKMMIQGRGMFTVQDPKTKDVMYTRLGDFHIDAQGSLVTREGFNVQGVPLQGAFTALKGPNPADPDDYGNVHFQDPFNNAKSNNAQELNAPGKPSGGINNISFKIDPENGKYLGLYDKIHVDRDGVVYGQDGRNLVSLYKLTVVNFNNPEGLTNHKDSIYFKTSKASGFPSLASADSKVIQEALEKSNTWIKTESHYLTSAQRYYQAATQIHKLSDKISGTAIEMIS